MNGGKRVFKSFYCKLLLKFLVIVDQDLPCYVTEKWKSLALHYVNFNVKKTTLLWSCNYSVIATAISVSTWIAFIDTWTYFFIVLGITFKWKLYFTRVWREVVLIKLLHNKGECWPRPLIESWHMKYALITTSLSVFYVDWIVFAFLRVRLNMLVRTMNNKHVSCCSVSLNSHAICRSYYFARSYNLS